MLDRYGRGKVDAKASGIEGKEYGHLLYDMKDDEDEEAWPVVGGKKSVWVDRWCERAGPSAVVDVEQLLKGPVRRMKLVGTQLTRGASWPESLAPGCHVSTCEWHWCAGPDKHTPFFVRRTRAFPFLVRKG